MLLILSFTETSNASEPIPLQGRKVPRQYREKAEGREDEGRGHALRDFKSQISNGKSEI